MPRKSTRETKEPEKFKPTNFNKASEKKKPEKKKPTVVKPVQPISITTATEVADHIEPQFYQAQPVARKKPVPKEPATVGKKSASKYSKKYRVPDDYKKLKMMDDELADDLTLLIQNVVFNRFEDETMKFTIWSKGYELSKSINSIYNGPNTIITKVFNMDYTAEQYKTLKYLNRPTFDEISRDVYVGDKKDDKNLTSGLRTIMNVCNLTSKASDLTSLLQQHRRILSEMLIYVEKNKRSPSTYWDYIRSLTRLARISVGEDDELYKKLFKFGDDFDKAILKSIEGENKLNKNEARTFLPYGTLLDMVDLMEKQYLDNKAKYGANHAKTYKSHINTLILMSYLYTPPVRLELEDARFTKTLNGLDKKKNYVYVNQNKATVKYVLNEIKKDHPSITYDVGYPVKDDALTNRLNEFIKMSFREYPREYFISLYTNKNKPAKKNMEKYLSKMFDGHSLGVNMFRSSYISWLYSNNVSSKIIDEVALKMRTSPATMLKNYKKLNTEQIKVKQEPRDDDEPIRIDESPAARGPVARAMVAATHGSAGGLPPPQPREPHKEYKDPVVANRMRVEKHIEKIGGKEVYNKKQSEYYKENKAKLDIKRALRKYNNSSHQPSKQIISKYKLYKDGTVWKSHDL